MGTLCDSEMLLDCGSRILGFIRVVSIQSIALNEENAILWSST